MGAEIFKKYEITLDERKKLADKVENFEMQVTHPFNDENDILNSPSKKLTIEENIAMYNAFIKKRKEMQEG